MLQVDGHSNKNTVLVMVSSKRQTVMCFLLRVKILKNKETTGFQSETEIWTTSVTRVK